MSAQKSKYSQAQVDALLNDLIITLEKHKAPVDLSLIALGNMVTNILMTNTTHEAQRKVLAEAFTDALHRSLLSSH